MSKKENIADNTGSITVTSVDFLRLSKLIQTLRGERSVDQVYLEFLGNELKNAVKTDSKLITPDFVTMNSVVSVFIPDSKRTMEMRLVYPREASFPKGLISVLSPLGCALLGSRAGDTVSFEAPGGVQKVLVGKVIYQPEANGEDLL